MIGFRAKATVDTGKVRRAAQTGSFKSLGHAAGALRLAVRRSIRRAKRPAAIGKPVHTQTGRVKGAYFYDVRKPDGPAVIGPAASIIGPAMYYHEFGGRRGKRYLPPRPTLGPALAAIGPRLSGYWAGTIRS